MGSSSDNGSLKEAVRLALEERDLVREMRRKPVEPKSFSPISNSKLIRQLKQQCRNTSSR